MTKILIVEDDITLLRLYQDIFNKEGFEVAIAEDGQEALQKANAFLPEVILLDLMLPYMDGFAVLEAVKANPKTKKAKIIIATNLDSQKQREKAKNLGAAAFLVKFSDTPGNIVEEVKKLLSTHNH